MGGGNAQVVSVPQAWSHREWLREMGSEWRDEGSSTRLGVHVLKGPTKAI